MQEGARTHTTPSIGHLSESNGIGTQVMWDVHTLQTGPHLERLLKAVRVPMRGSNQEWFALKRSISNALERLYDGIDAGRTTSPLA